MTDTKQAKYLKTLGELNTLTKHPTPKAKIKPQSSELVQLPFQKVITIHLSGVDYTLKYGEDLEIYEDMLDEHLAKQPGFYAFYNKILALQKKKVDTLKLEIKELEARLFLVIKTKLSSSPDRKPPTLSEIEAYSTSEKGLKEKRRELLDEQYILDVLWGVKDAWAQRKDSLMTISANKRREWDTELFLNKRKHEREK